MTDPTAHAADALERRLLPLIAWAGIGAVAAVVGLLPWIVTGMRLPLQYLWATDTLPGDMPIALVPFSQYAVTLLVGLVITAWAAGGVVTRALATRVPRHGLLVLAGTIGVLQGVAIVQTAVVVQRGLTDRAASTLYVAALVALVVVAVLLGAVLLRVIARGARAPAVVALSVCSLAVGFWLSGLLAPLGRPVGELQLLLLPIADRLPAVLIGAAIVWVGLRGAGRIVPGRIVAAVAALVILWVAPALATAVSAAVGSRILLPYPLEMLDYGWGVFRQALVLPELVLPRLLLATAIAVVGLGVRELLVRRSPAP